MSLVTVCTYRDPVNAELMRAKLESEGIAAYVFDQHTAGVQWLYSLAIGGVKVKVDEADFEAALEAIRRDLPTESAPPVLEDLCPVCGSADIRASRLQRVSGAASLASGLPLLFWSSRWVCRACSHAWVPESDSTPSPLTIEAERAVHEEHSYPLFRKIAFAGVAILLLWFIRDRIQNG